MEAGVKIAAAGSVLLGGIVAALLFRHDAAGAGPAVTTGRADQLVLQKQFQPRRAGGPAAGQYRDRFKMPLSMSPSPQASGQKATILTPTGPGEAPPPLERDYPGVVRPDSSGWGTSIELPSATRPGHAVRAHKIVDGDTLGALAERYLGSAARCLDIFEANRDRLSSPELLPIGVELRIPPPRGQIPSAPDLIRRRALVPIPRSGVGVD